MGKRKLKRKIKRLHMQLAGLRRANAFLHSARRLGDGNIRIKVGEPGASGGSKASAGVDLFSPVASINILDAARKAYPDIFKPAADAAEAVTVVMSPHVIGRDQTVMSGKGATFFVVDDPHDPEAKHNLAGG
jgi:hypothetical protein